ncbi:MAG: nitrate- and nitrite sensing domain-containing protein [Campylobacterota bacterium]|nr:nitrate- and nitrite sensing domain-containing protein [Campylobacterota bacterium]
MNSLSIKNKLLLLSAVALIVIFAYSLKIANNNYTSYINDTRTYTIVELSVKISSVLHELQKERGASAGFLGTGGKKFKDIVLFQRIETNNKIKELEDFIAKYDTPEIEIIKKIDLKSIQMIRKKIDVQSITTKTALTFYTLLNKSLIDTIAYYSTVPKDSQIKTNFNAFVIFISSKEKAGIERAILSGVFAMDKFTLDSFAKFSSLASEQQTLLNLFFNSTNKKMKSEFRLLKKDATFSEVQRLRDIAFSKNEKFGVDSVYCFKTMTTKIEKLKEFEDKIAYDTIGLANNMANNAIRTLIILAFLTIIVFLFTLYISYHVTRGITKAFKELEVTLSTIDEYVIYSKTDLKGTITYASKAFIDISGYTKDELIGKPHNIIRHPDMSASIFKDLWETIQSGKVWEGNIKNLKKDGGFYWVHASIEPIFDNKGNIFSYTATRTDITDKMELKTLIENQNIIIEEKTQFANEQRDKALKSAKAKGEFLANMSHELRTPLNSIIGFSNILNKKSRDYDHTTLTPQISSSAESLLHLINDILDLSKIQDSKFTIEPYKFNAYDEINIYIQQLDGLTLKKQLRFKNNIDDTLKGIFFGDWHRINQIIVNLISNAIKFTPANGEIKYDVFHKDNNLIINISDNGIGMNKEAQDKIFKPFEQADGSTTRKYGGTGLGLSITQNLVELMNGKIELESQEGKGSTFKITIPLEKIEDANEETVEVDFDEGNEQSHLTGHILIVEDNATNQMLIKMIIEEFGLTCDMANDGVEAVEIYNPNTHALILMDENMPNMNGVEAMKVIREKYEDRCGAIIALTANAMEGEKDRFLNLGMDGYIAKPIDVNILYKTLRKFGIK